MDDEIFLGGQKMKTSQLAIRYFLLWLIITILIMAVSALFSIQKYFQLAEAQMQTAAIMNLVVNLTYALILGTIVHLSTWHGIKLIGALFLAFFGITGFLTQIETWAYLKVLVDIVPMPAIRRLVIGSIINGVLVSVLTPVIWGKLKGKNVQNPDSAWLELPASQWAWKLAAIGIAYIVIYFAFGALVAKPLAGEIFYKYYSNLHIPAWMIPFQFGRGLIWAATAIPIYFMVKGNRLRTGLIVSLMFPTLMGVVMIIPNPIMPDRMRLAHLVELMTSNFVLGWTIFFILSAGRHKVASTFALPHKV